jgi:hypothetical protein
MNFSFSSLSHCGQEVGALLRRMVWSYQSERKPDSALASQIQELKRQYAIGQVLDVNDALIQIIRERYSMASKGDQAAAP